MTFLKKVFGGGGRTSSATTAVPSNDAGIAGGGGKVSKLTEAATPNSSLLTAMPAEDSLVPHTVATPTLNNLVPHSMPPPLSLSMGVAPADNASTIAMGPDTVTGTAAPSPQKQFKFADLEVTRTLGTGSFGRVCLALHRPTGVYYAMKRLRKSDVVRLKQVEHTNNERSLLASVDHPFLVRMVCTFQDERHLYIILDYISGGELFSLLRKVRTLPPFVAQFYAAEVVLAIQYLHERNIVYRDLKPENILLTREGHIRLTDFGFAKVVPELTWTLCGTPDYLAPEIVMSRGYGKAVDWYAVGVLIYEMLLGAPPFYHENHMKLYDNIVNQTPRFPVGFDAIARDLIERLLEKNPSKRLGSLAGGPEDIKSHPWFRDVKWDLLHDLRIKAPYRPKVAHEGDTSNFDEYPPEAPETEPIDSKAFEGLFPGF